MVVPTSADSDSAELSPVFFNGERVVHSFPRHDVVKLTDATFVIWQQQVKLILDGYDLLGFLDGTVPPPPQNLHTADGVLAPNPSALVFKQQDRLLTSWLLTTIDAALLPSFTEARSACDVWNTASELFAADTGAKQSRLRHELHSLKKGTLSVTAYVTRIKNICSILETSGSRISDTEKLEIILAGLPPEFEGVVSSASLSTGPLSLQRVVNALVECETRLHRATQDVSLHANLVESASVGDGSVRGGRSSPRGRGRNFKPRIQCQICNRFGHLAQRCDYRYRRESEDSPPVFNRSVEVPLPGHGFGVPNDGKGENDWGFHAKVAASAGDYGYQSARGPLAHNGQNFQMARGPHYAYNDPRLVHLPRYSGPIPYGRDVGSFRGPGLVPNENDVARPDAPSAPITNHVQVSPPWELGPNVGPGGASVPWLTKPQAQVYSGSDPCIGLPRVGDINASDYSDASGSNVNTAQVGSNGVGGDSYLPMPIGTSSWYPDSGASHHVCRDPMALRDTTPYSGTSSLLMGDGTPAQIVSLGSRNLSTPLKLLRLSNVLCVPSIRKNLLSVSQFAKDNEVFFEFHPTYCVIKDIKTKDTLLKGHIRDGLYHFPVSAVDPFVAHVKLQNKPVDCPVFALWHSRLGHPSGTVVRSVLQKCNIAFNKSCVDGVCSACQKGKSYKLPFSVSNTVYQPFELVVSDLWGPGAVACENKWYYVTFVDVCTRFTWLYLLTQKSQALKCFTRFQQLIKTQFGKTIKQFQSDWGGEYRAFTRVLASQGIVHRLTCPYTSEQNGIVERKHRHIVDMGLTLLAQADLSMRYWGYAFCCAVHLINRLPTPVLQGKSPFQVLYGQDPTYDYLRVFGCCCYPYLRPFASNKLEFRSQPSTFLGYSTQHKGYQCLLPDGKIVVSRHVVFDETKFLSSKDPCTTLGLNPGVTVSTTVPLVRGVVSHPMVPVADFPILPSVSSPAISGNDSESPSMPLIPAEPPASGPGSIESEAPSNGSTASCGSHNVLNNTNIHPMVTRAKAGIFKPRALSVEVMEPSTIEEALSSAEWRAAAQAEYEALIQNSTWDLVPLPPGRKVIGCKWLFKIKRNPDGTIARRKARLVAKGCSQVPGFDFKETFSPVVKLATIRVILSVAVSIGWPLRQVDVNNAFLNGDIDTEVFMHQPPGYVQTGLDGKQLVCRLKKALYGLRQAPRAWFDKLKCFFVSIGFVASRSDASLFVRTQSESTLYVLVYVDDIIITGSSSTIIDWFVRLLHEKFSLKDMGDLHFFLGIEVTRSSTGSVHLCQAKYIRDILARASMATAKSVPTPMVSSSVMSKDDGECLVDPTEFRSLAGALQYVVLTRPDIAYAVNRICQFMHNPTSLHMTALKRILRYLCGFCVYFGAAPVSWGSKKQQVVSRSTAEAEYIGVLPPPPVKFCGAVAVAANLVLHSKFKHVELDLFFVREKVADGSIFVSEVPACDQAADVFTKPLSTTLFSRFRKFLRVFSVRELDECKGSVS
ncbi:hypothetical protein CXB51_010719 [Gossypium anomalum]|uniref:Integrase catalytic domain-containing protein n=1 Tax=Gossypium anomalum TaxID=47600 RepID=A0A8J6D6S0_9ROSI|nr:hypothetical protein CXB51_010719 [Gossypium anomalum]